MKVRFPPPEKRLGIDEFDFQGIEKSGEKISATIQLNSDYKLNHSITTLRLAAFELQQSSGSRGSQQQTRLR